MTSFHPGRVCNLHPCGSDDGRVPDVAEITLRCRGARRLTAGFDGWDVEPRGVMTVLRRAGATTAEVHAALVEVADLGLELESFRRLEPA
jgi:hypothetical protein